MKTFIVPEKIGKYVTFVYNEGDGPVPHCAAGHLMRYFGINKSDSSWSILASRMGIPEHRLHALTFDNDTTSEYDHTARRAVLINWLRANFPNQEVK